MRHREEEHKNDKINAETINKHTKSLDNASNNKTNIKERKRRIYEKEFTNIYIHQLSLLLMRQMYTRCSLEWLYGFGHPIRCLDRM